MLDREPGVPPARTVYHRLRAARPEFFANPGNGGFEIIVDAGTMNSVEASASRRLRDAGGLAESARVGVLYDDHGVLIVQDAVRFPDGSLGTYVRLLPGATRGHGVAILATRSGKVVLVRHHRHATRQWHLEIPRGFGASGSNTHEDAKRELEEETGLRATTLSHLGSVHPDTGLSGHLVQIWHAEVEGQARPDIHEGILEVVELEPSRLMEMIGTGDVTDGFTIVALTLGRAAGILPSA